MKMNIFFTFFIILFNISTTQVYSQKMLDSLQNALPGSQGIQKVDILNKIAKEYRRYYAEKCIENGNKALELAKKLNYKKGEVEAILYIGAGKSYNESPKKSLAYFENALKMCKDINFTEGIAFSLRYLGICEANLGDHNASNEYYKKALKVGSEINYFEGNGYCYSNLGENYQIIGNQAEAINNYLKAFEIFDRIGYYKDAINVLIQIGSTYRKLNNIEKAVETYFKVFHYSNDKAGNPDNASSYIAIAMVYLEWNNYPKVMEYGEKATKLLENSGNLFDYAQILQAQGTFFNYIMNEPDKALENLTKALKLYTKINDKEYMAVEYLEIGNVYLRKKDYKKALDNYRQALTISREIERNQYISDVLNTIGNLYSQTHEYDKALNYFQQGLQLAQKDSLVYAVAANQFDLGNTYNLIKDYKSASFYLKKALDLSLALSEQEKVKEVYKALADVYYNLSDYKQAYEYSSLYSKLADSLAAVKNNKKLSDMNLNYELDNKEKEFDLLKKDKQLEVIILIGGLIILLILAAFLFSRYINKQKAAKKFAEKNLELEHINNKLSESESDLKTLNIEKDAFLTHINSELSQAAEYVRSLLPEPITKGVIKVNWRFVPSTQLGGDSFGYYWLDNDTFIIYLLDVCGHGIGPSLHSVSVLNTLKLQRLPDTDYKNPSSVLASLNKSFQMKFNRNMFFTIWYGVYNKVKKELYYSCAGHPPAILIQPNKNAVKLRTENYAIGGVPEFYYKSDNIPIPDFTKLFIFSDGVYDMRQIGSNIWNIEELQDYLLNSFTTNGHDLDNLYDHVKNLIGENKLEDDFSILKVEF